ncbi:hypothetical protein [Mycetocola spongiae]|uniref:hypothetical protein n=1 Tax=Mycetocola spongiae TaxID=2859226 RepID=UPI001CF36660|nr:hypothetical protein [Mycetocola spongiae]UCR89342.1 hypothetical protein KXZ72_01135 [Mycetocola spongiae]
MTDPNYGQYDPFPDSTVPTLAIFPTWPAATISGTTLPMYYADWGKNEIPLNSWPLDWTAVRAPGENPVIHTGHMPVELAISIVSAIDEYGLPVTRTLYELELGHPDEPQDSYEIRGDSIIIDLDSVFDGAWTHLIIHAAWAVAPTKNSGPEALQVAYALRNHRD